MKKCLTYIIVIVSQFIAIHQIHAQPPTDISGQWNGIVGVPLGEDLLSIFEFQQMGLILEGYQTLKSKDGKDSSKVKILGTVDGNAIQFKSTEFIYKTDNSCLSESSLRYTSDGNQEKLTGKWKGDWSLSTCPPGAKGIVELVKLKNENVLLSKSIQTASVLAIESDDEDGVSLFEELQQRKYFALIIGINKYENEGIQDLSLRNRKTLLPTLRASAFDFV